MLFVFNILFRFKSYSFGAHMLPHLQLSTYRYYFDMRNGIDTLAQLSASCMYSYNMALLCKNV